MVYKPFVASSGTGKHSSVCFHREMNHVLSNPPPSAGEEQPEGKQQRVRRLRVLPDISGHSTVFLPGRSASFVFKTSTSSPHVIRMRGEFVRGLGSFDSVATGCEKGFVYLDSKVSRFTHFHILHTKESRIPFGYASCPMARGLITHCQCG